MAVQPVLLILASQSSPVVDDKDRGMVRNPMRAILLAALLLCSPMAAYAQQPGGLEAARASVVSVLPVWPGQAPNSDEPEGSGVVIGDGRRVVTADHVLGPGQSPRLVFVRDSDGVIHEAKVVHRDKLTDVAVLELDAGLPPAARRAGPVMVGQEVCAIGNAFGLDLSVTCGHVSAVHRTGVGFNAVEDFIQTDAAVNPGMSGGALVDSEGRLAGMLSAIFTKQADANIGVNFAVHMELVDAVVDDASAGRQLFPFKTGVQARPVPPKGETGREGLQIVNVIAGSAAEAAQLKPGDLIYHAGGRRVRKMADWVSVMAQTRPGGTVDVAGERNGEPFKATLTNQ